MGVTVWQYGEEMLRFEVSASEGKNVLMKDGLITRPEARGGSYPYEKPANQPQRPASHVVRVMVSFVVVDVDDFVPSFINNGSVVDTVDGEMYDHVSDANHCPGAVQFFFSL